MNKTKKTNLVNQRMNYLQKRRELERRKKTKFFFMLRRNMESALVAKPTVFNINYKNGTLLGNFFDSEGKILSREITKITAKEQRQITRAIKRSRMSILVPYNHPSIVRIKNTRHFFIKTKSRNFINLNKKKHAL